MPLNSMTGDSGDGFDFDLPDAKPVPTVLPAMPDLPAANAEATATGVTLNLKDVLAATGADETDDIVWEDLPDAKPVQPDDGVVDPPSADDINLQ